MLARRIGFAVLALAAAVITFTLGPEPAGTVNTASYDRQITQALSDYDANNALTAGAPQQQVVNGWITRDMLTVLAQQTNDLLEVSAPAAADDRLALLLFVLVLTVCWHAAVPAPTLAGGHRTEPDDGYGNGPAPVAAAPNTPTAGLDAPDAPASAPAASPWTSTQPGPVDEADPADHRP